MKKAIIVGASSGIGLELSKILSENNYKVGITGRRESNLEEIRESNPEKFEVSSFDCTENNNAFELQKLADRLGGLDLLIISSGTSDLNEELDYEIENRTNQLNVIAFTEIADWAINYFVNQGAGHLVGISSVAGIRGGRFAPAYFASKAYQINYLEGLRQKVTKTKKPIYITDIRPGFVDTAMAKGEGIFWMASKEKASKQIFGFIKRKKNIGYVTKRWRLIAIILRRLPNWIHKRM